MKRAALALALLLAGSPVRAGDPAAPTADTAPAALDRQWIASVAKFDAPRRALLRTIDRTVAAGPFRADYGSLGHYEAPAWFRDAKFGIFVHWGVYAVPAYGNTWYPNQMYLPGSDIFKHHVATYGAQERFGFKDFIPLFRAEHFDPDAWAALFQAAGARYVVPVFEHHDGFAMYDSALSDWTSVKMGPHRDTSGELAKAVRARGMRLGASFHRIEHDFFFGGGRGFRSDINDPRYASLYGPAHHWLQADADDAVYDDFTYLSRAFLDDWLARSAEIVEKYHPDLMYFDWWNGQPGARDALARFAAYYYDATLRRGGVGVLTYKYYAMRAHSAVLDVERGQLDDMRALPWQTDTSISTKSWGYLADDSFKTPDAIVHQLVDVVSKNGNLLLNVGPRADGTIPDPVRDALLAVGRGLTVNGEAIYGTRPWIVYGEGPNKVSGGAFNDTKPVEWTPEDFRFTARDDALYAIKMGRPATGEAVIRSLASSSGVRVGKVRLLGRDGLLAFSQGADGLHVAPPPSVPEGIAWVYRIDRAR